MIPVTRSVFDVVYRLYDLALNDNEYLQPQKLHRLLYLAQAYYGATFEGRWLMPAVFLAEEAGPLEPNVYAALENGRPDVALKPIDDRCRHFLDSLWRQFGHHTAEHLTMLLKNQPPYLEAYDRAPGSVISYKSMVAYFREARSPATPEPKKVLRPRVMRSHTGKPVSTSHWFPRKLK